jgi:hypothetical protein
VSEVPKIKLFFEWGGGVLWCANDAAHQRFDVGPIEDKLSLPNEIRERLHGMAVWHDTALDWNNPPGPSPWSKAEDLRFAEAVYQLVEEIRRELGPGYEVISEHCPVY